jgi:hypothetical protein
MRQELSFFPTRGINVATLPLVFERVNELGRRGG